MKQPTLREILMNYEPRPSAEVDQAEAAIQALIYQEVEKAYRKGYNDNARDCYCKDSQVFPGSQIPHHHLLTDGESHSIKPDINSFKKGKR